MSGASEQTKGRARGPVLTSRFLFVPDHGAPASSAAAVWSPPPRPKGELEAGLEALEERETWHSVGEIVKSSTKSGFKCCT